MKKLALAAALLATTAVAAPAFAQEGFYAGVGGTHYDTDNVEVDGVTGRAGYRFTPHFALEGEGTIGVGDDDDAELDHALGAYAVGIVPISQNFDLFGRVGYQTLETDTDTGLTGIDDDGVGFGGGVEWRPGGGRFGVRGEYTRLENDGDGVDSATVTGVMHF